MKLNLKLIYFKLLLFIIKLLIIIINIINIFITLNVINSFYCFIKLILNNKIINIFQNKKYYQYQFFSSYIGFTTYVM